MRLKSVRRLHLGWAGIAVAAIYLAASGVNAGAANTEIGQIAPTLQATCKPKPGDCTAIGKVTGFQEVQDGRRNPYVVSEDGKIVSWGVTLGTPGNWEDFFDGVFGKGPKARLAVLRETSRTNRYKLVGQSETASLSSFYGSSPTFALGDPIKVKKGDKLALSMITWAPVFRVNLSRNFSWRADRTQKNCNKVRKGVVHKRGTRPYECVFNTAQLLYHAELEA